MSRINTKTTYNQTRLVNNIIKIYNRVDEETHELGWWWYHNAHDWCRDRAQEFGASIQQVIGVVSALSPGVSWDINKMDALSLLRYKFGFTNRPIVSTYRANLRKAERILDGEDPEVVIQGPKTRAFYYNILDPMCPKNVCCDRHAIKVARGMSKGGSLAITKLQYTLVEAAYQKAADKLEIAPARLQAIVWTQYKIEQGR